MRSKWMNKMYAPDGVNVDGVVTETQTPPPQEFEDMNVSGQIYKVPKGLSKIWGKSISEERNKYKKEVEALNTELADKGKTLEEKQRILAEYEEKFLSAEEKARKEARSEIDKAKKEAEEVKKDKEKYFNLFQSQSIDAEIRSALSAYQVYNQDQVLTLFKNSGIKILFEENKQTGRYETKFELTKDGGPVIVSAKDAISEFLSQESNLNLLRVEGRPGGSTQYKGAGTLSGTGSPIYRKEDFVKPDVRAKFKADIEAGLNPQLQ